MRFLIFDCRLKINLVARAEETVEVSISNQKSAISNQQF
jgi:hypothetical protein